VEGIVSGKYVFCPLHDWKIDLKDGRVQAPDHGCVQSYEVVIEGEEVYITL
jgi:nitrite reductase (NADH) small subunit